MIRKWDEEESGYVTLTLSNPMCGARPDVGPKASQDRTGNGAWQCTRASSSRGSRQRLREDTCAELLVRGLQEVPSLHESLRDKVAHKHFSWWRCSDHFRTCGLHTDDRDVCRRTSWRSSLLCCRRHLCCVPTLADGRGGLCAFSQDQSAAEVRVLLTTTTSSERDAEGKQTVSTRWSSCFFGLATSSPRVMLMVFWHSFDRYMLTVCWPCSTFSTSPHFLGAKIPSSLISKFSDGANVSRCKVSGMPAGPK